MVPERSVAEKDDKDNKDVKSGCPAGGEAARRTEGFAPRFRR